MKKYFVAFAALVAMSASGCDDNHFESFHEIRRLRPLAVVKTPPEVAAGEAVELRLVAVHPDSQELITVEWELCVFASGADGDHACEDGVIVEGIENVLARGEGSSIMWTQDFADSDTLQAACEALYSQGGVDIPAYITLPNCDYGVPVSYRAILRCEGPVGCEDDVIVYGSLTLLIDEAAQRADRNENPSIVGLSAGDLSLQQMPPATLDFVADEDVRLTALVNADTAQVFVAPDSEDGAEEREQLETVWFSTHGELGRGGGFYAEDLVELEELQSNTITFGGDSGDEFAGRDGDLVRIWVVLRDNRGGFAVEEGSFVLREVE